MVDTHPIRFRGIDHVVLRVSDIARSLRFYVEVLGLSLERIIEDLQIYQLRCGRNLIDLTAAPGSSFAPPDAREMLHLCLMLDCSLAAVRRHLAEHGVAVVSGPVEVYGATGFGTSIYVRDPDQHLLELKAAYAEFPQKITLKDAMASGTRPPGG